MCLRDVLVLEDYSAGHSGRSAASTSCTPSRHGRDFAEIVPRLGRDWAEIGPRLGRGWAEIGPRSGRGWAEIGPGLGRGERGPGDHPRLSRGQEPLEENIDICVSYLQQMAKLDMLLEMELGSPRRRRATGAAVRATSATCPRGAA